MVITAIEEAKKNEERCNVYVDGAYLFACYKETAVEFALIKGKKLNKELVDEIKKEDAVLYAFSVGLRYLSKRARTKKYVIDKLKDREVDEDAIFAAIQKLEDYGYLDDLEYACTYAEELSQKYGKKMIYHRLLGRGIEQQVAQQAVEQVDESQALQLAKESFDRRYKDEKDSYKRKQKTVAALMRRGFEYEDIKQLVELDYER